MVILAWCLGSSAVKTVAVRHRHATYYNKHWWWTSWKCQDRWPWM